MQSVSGSDARNESSLAIVLGEGTRVALILVPVPRDDRAKPYFTRKPIAAITASGSKEDFLMRALLVCHLPSFARDHNSSTTLSEEIFSIRCTESTNKLGLNANLNLNDAR